MKYVILGTAHGSNVAGKCSPDKRLREYKYSREICAKVKAVLDAKGIPCTIDIEGDYEAGLNSRVRLVNKIVAEHGGAKNCVYISIHNNAAGNGDWRSARGFCVYAYTGASASSKALASIFAKNAKEMQLKGNRAWPATQYYTANFAVLRGTTCPAVLTENMFQDNINDVEFLLSEEGKAAIVKLHVDSVCEYIDKA